MKTLTFVAVVIAKAAIVQSYRITKVMRTATKEEQEKQVITEDPEIKKIHKNQVKFANIMGVVLLTAGYMTGILFIGEGLYKIYYFYEANPNINPTDPKPHCIFFWFPFNRDEYYKTSILYEIFHILQTLNYNGAAQTVVCSVMVFLKTELKILQHNISSLKYSNASNIEDILKKYSKKHQELIRSVKDFNISFQYIILLEYSMISVTLATTLLGILEGQNIAFNALFFTMNFLQLFALSWNANEILHESSSKLADAIYFCPWYEFDTPCKYLILFMLLKCKTPLAIANGPFGHLTMEAAVSRIKLSYSVVSVFSTST
ncbi:odorant receptor 10-like [Euwallacea fornicatus]|uniref:odorant receptor 10-like n=1 Tax=Euwallacea fornicatus TaxID=995702 RepID=UPI0033900389